MPGGDKAVVNNDKALVEVDVDADGSSSDDSDKAYDETGDEGESNEIIVSDE